MKKKLKELAELVGGNVIGDGEAEVSGVAAIEEAGPGDITFVVNPKFHSMLDQTRASAIIMREPVSTEKPLLLVPNPYLAFAKLLALFYQKPYHPGGIDPNASVSPTARLGSEITLSPFAYVGDRAQIGDRVRLYPGVYVGEDSSVGDDSILYPGVSVYPGTIIGKRVILHAGAVIGADGFGYVKEGEKNVKIPQMGRVEIGDDVEIGANATVDRATLGKTIVESGVKIDNLVMVAHNVIVGQDSILVAQVGIAGSTRIGKNVTLAGQVGVTDHVNIGDNVRVGAQSGVAFDLAPNQAYTGSPAIAHRDALRAAMLVPKLPEMKRTLEEVKRRLEKIEKILSSGKEED
jgi:UDP-3-O-[3-hydroxymyristoyl] glucosamine N-acyltransferase